MKKFILQNKDMYSLKCKIGKEQNKKEKSNSYANDYFEEDFQKVDHSKENNAYQFNINTAI